MKIVSKCPGCKEEAEIKANASTRPDLAQIKGVTLALTVATAARILPRM